MVVEGLAVIIVVQHVMVLCCVRNAVKTYNIVHVWRDNLMPDLT